jgi:hypothetical protein
LLKESILNLLKKEENSADVYKYLLESEKGMKILSNYEALLKNNSTDSNFQEIDFLYTLITNNIELNDF